MREEPKIYLALPVLNESEELPGLMKCLEDQNFINFEVIICVNQYDSWWNIPEKIPLCLDNQKSIQFLKTQDKLNLTVLDKCSAGLGWPDRRGGVGWARKTAIDHINEIANDKDLIVSIDADTYYPPDYFNSILQSFNADPKLAGLAIPYYHKLNGTRTDTLILRYEIYMRNYLIQMLRINSPYAFTAVGSAIAVPVWAYRKIGGISPVKSGEDFYFLQKLVKNGKLGVWTNTIAYPSARLSDRVVFGTGPALLKGERGDWDSYPIYPGSLFKRVKSTFDLFPVLYVKDIETPMDDFLKKQFRSEDLWTKLRKNYKDQRNFVKACRTKVDGLRILQYLKKEYNAGELYSYQMWDELQIELNLPQIHDMEFKELSDIREMLLEEETVLRKKIASIGV